jgi:phage terminase large subunit-like protein
MLYDKWTPNSVCVEGGGSASGKATVNLLSRSTSIPFKETITCTDKEFRAGACEPTHEAKLCCLFEGNDFNAKFVDNCANFPNIKNDDDVDAWMLAIEEINGGPKNFQFSPELLAALGAGGRR